ncbi:MAG TPA: bifunctional phosphopantothenoylcysteine decarboxylase/phosphopantothenate--cysteine ligase CoaBC, partial [Limnochordia bacterium]
MRERPRIVHGVCGGISAYKAVEVVRRLVDAGCEVHVVMTAEATRFVAPLTFRELSYHPVETDLFASEGRLMRHLDLAESCDLFLVAPATAHTIAKLAHGLADDLLSTVALSVRAPRLIAPAMDAEMYAHPATQANLARLAGWGYTIVGPEEGRLARGNRGKGRLAAPERIVAAALAALGRRRDLADRRILITAGATQEPMDPVRYLTNGASGRMGVALAEAACARGATVTLIAGALQVPEPAGVECIRVRTAKEMYAAVMARFEQVDAVIKAAAVSDYRFASIAAQKVKKEEERLSVELVRTPDIL